MESTDSSSSSRQPHLPPGFRFHPTDEELVVHYLKKKAASAPLPVTVIADVDLYKFDPWELPGQATFGEQEWYFFSPRDRKYPNGARPNRAATSGYWKATGTDKPILTAAGNQKVGVKKALVFYGGRPPKGVKTNWIMHEYRLVDTTTSTTAAAAAAAAANNSTDHHISTTKKASLRLDDWVLCRIYKKNNPNRPTERDKGDCHHVEEMIAGSLLNPSCPKPQLLVQKPGYGSVLDNGGAGVDENFFQGLLASEEGNIQVGGGTAAASSSSVGSKSDLSVVPLHAGLRQLPPKRYWHSVEAAGGVKRLNTNGSCDNSVGGSVGGGANSFPTTLLNQVVLPQPAPPFQHSFIGNVVGEGIFRQPYPLSGINWGT